MKINRRDLLGGGACATGAALLRRATGWPGAELFAQNFGLASLPSPEESGIGHIVVVMMENRSFDHFLGWLSASVGRFSSSRMSPNISRAGNMLDDALA